MEHFHRARRVSVLDAYSECVDSESVCVCACRTCVDRDKEKSVCRSEESEFLTHITYRESVRDVKRGGVAG